MSLKIFEFDLYLKHKARIPKMNMVKGDSNGNLLRITLKDSKDGFKFTPVDLTNVDYVTLIFKKEDENRVEGTATIVDPSIGLIEYLVKGNEIAYLGQVIAEVQVYPFNGRYTTAQFVFNVLESLDDDTAIESTTEYTVLTTLIQENHAIQQEEALRVSAENQRKSNETTRQSEHSLRLTAAGNAISLAEASAERANTSASNADLKASAANLAAQSANQSATRVDNAITQAETAAQNANTAATQANAAKDGIQAQYNAVANDLSQHKTDYATLISDVNLQHREYQNPLNIIPPDNNPSVCHPSVVKIDGGLNGFEYWMAYTPFPLDKRENPHIVASHDGVKWVEPKGINNPVVSLSHIQSLGFGYNSDVNLLYVNGLLELYYRGAGLGKEAIFRRTSIDGINWINEQEILINPDALTGSRLLSPSVVYENGKYLLWVIDRVDNDNRKLVLYKSENGLSYTMERDCVVSGLSKTTSYLWHHEIRKIAGKYYMLSSEYSTWNMIFAMSVDGVNWSVDYNNNILSLEGHSFSADAFYKATFVPSYGDKLTFDIWVNVVKKDIGGAANSNTSQHRISFYKNVDLIGGSEKVALKNMQRIWIGVDRFINALGNPIWECQNQTVPYIRCNAGQHIRVRTSVVLPLYMRQVFYRVYWANISETPLETKSIYLRMGVSKAKAGLLSTNTESLFSGHQYPLTVGTQYEIKVTDMTAVLRPVELKLGEFLLFELGRRGNDASDNFTGDIAIFGLEILGYIPS